jgi:hypothetical protein
VSAETQQTHVQKLSPENKEVSPYIPLQAGYISKKRGLIHIWLYTILFVLYPSVVAGRRIRRKQSLSSDKVARGRDGIAER